MPARPGDGLIDQVIDTLMTQHGDRVMGLLRRVLAHEEDARDSYQDTWFSLWRASARLRWADDPWPFIRKTALRKAIDRLRASRRSGARERAIDFDPVAPAPAGAPEVDLGELNGEERACLVLYFWEECSVREIAGVLDVPSGTVKTWMFRARAKLRRRMARQPKEASR